MKIIKWVPLVSAIFILCTLTTGCVKEEEVIEEVVEEVKEEVREEKSEPSPTVINASIMASDSVNPDGTGRPSPIIIRVYELKAVGAFDAADFFKLYEDDQAILGEDLIHKEEYRLQPGGVKEYSRTVTTETQYFAIMAAYHGLDQAVWKTSLEISENQTNKLSILLDALEVSMRAE